MSLVCELNFGSGTLTESTQVRPSRQSSPVSATLSFFADARLVGVFGDDAGQRGAEAGEMRAAVALRDVVGEAQHALVIASRSTMSAASTMMFSRSPRSRIGRGDQRRLGAVEIAHEGFEAAVVVQHDLLLLDAALVGQNDRHAGIEEGELAQAMLERGEVEFGLGEGLRARAGTSLPCRACRRAVADDRERRHGHRRRGSACRIPGRRARCADRAIRTAR